MTSTLHPPLRQAATGTQLVIDLYARISKSTTETRGRNVEDQVLDGTDDIESRGAAVGRVFRDESLSAWNAKVERPDFNELVQRLATGQSHGVWVGELSRYTRKLNEATTLMELARDKGIVVWSEDNTYDLQTADGRKAFMDKALDNWHESEKISERTRRGKRRKARRGRTNATHRGFAMPGYLPNPEGWITGDPRTEVPAEQLAAEVAAVRYVADRLLAGASWPELVDYVNGQGLRTYAGNAWDTDSLRQMMVRPSLSGALVHDGEVIGRLQGEPVLDQDTYDRLHAYLSSRARGRKPGGLYLLSGLLTCGQCGSRLYGRPRTNGSPYSDGEVRREYWCQKRSGHEVTGCGRLNVDQRFADAVVKAATLATLADPQHATRLARRTKAVQQARVTLTSRRDDLNAMADNLAAKVHAWGEQRVDRAMAPILADLQQVEADLLALGAPEAAGDDGGALVEWDHPEVTVVQRQRMVQRAFPQGITVQPAVKRGKASRDPLRFTYN